MFSGLRWTECTSQLAPIQQADRAPPLGGDGAFSALRAGLPVAGSKAPAAAVGVATAPAEFAADSFSAERPPAVITTWRHEGVSARNGKNRTLSPYPQRRANAGEEKTKLASELSIGRKPLYE